jgi:hypothetical protein
LSYRVLFQKGGFRLEIFGNAQPSFSYAVPEARVFRVSSGSSDETHASVGLVPGGSRPIAGVSWEPQIHIPRTAFGVAQQPCQKPVALTCVNHKNGQNA